MGVPQAAVPLLGIAVLMAASLVIVLFGRRLRDAGRLVDRLADPRPTVAELEHEWAATGARR